jgi:serine/threonine-protein kinase HipA
LGTAQEYNSTCERVARTIKDFVLGEFLQGAREEFFASLVVSCMIRNGDAHLKNFGSLYERPGQPVRLAPVYDMVTTVAYIPRDVPALSLAGTKKWWPRKVLEKFAVIQLSLPVGKVGQIFEEAAEAMNDTRGMLTAYMADHPEFREVGGRMLAAWNEGVTTTFSMKVSTCIFIIRSFEHKFP